MVVGGFLLILPGLLTDAAGVLIALIGLSASLKQRNNRRTQPNEGSAIIEGEFEPSSDSETSRRTLISCRLVQSPSTDFAIMCADLVSRRPT